MFLFRGSRVQVVISGERRSWAFHVVYFCDSAAGAAVLPAVSRLAWAQPWPARLIRTIVPFTPGTATCPSALVSRLLSKTEQARAVLLAPPSWRRLILMDTQFS